MDRRLRAPLGLALLIVAAIASPRELPAQTPVGSEILVDGDSVLAPLRSYGIRVGLAADGSFVTLWVRETNLYARLFRANGTARGPAILITRGTDASALAVSPDGSFLVVWPKTGALVGWRFDKNGRSVGTVFNVNAAAQGGSDPTVARAPDGTFVVAWVRRVPPNPFVTEQAPYDIFLRRFSATGSPLSGEINVTPFLEAQLNPRLAVDPLGRFALTYTHYADEQEDWYDDIEALRLGTNAAPRGTRIYVNSDSPNDGRQAYEQYDPDIAMAADGSFTVVWASAEPIDDLIDIPAGLYARQFHADGTRKGLPIFLQPAGTNWLESPAITQAPGGGFLLVWSRMNAARSAGRLLGRRFSSTGTPLAPSFLVDAYSSGSSLDAAVALNAQGGGVVVWRRHDSATGINRIVLRRLAPPAGP